MNTRHVAHVKINPHQMVGNVEILVTDYHGEYKIPAQGVHLYTLYDGHQVGSTIEALDLLPTKPEPITKSYLTEVMAKEKALQIKVMTHVLDGHGYDRAALVREGHLEGLDYGDITICRLWGSEKAHNSNCEHWMNLLIMYAESVGGDDNYYDYFPGFFESFMSYAIGLNRLDLLEIACFEVRKFYMAHDAWEDDLIPEFNANLYK